MTVTSAMVLTMTIGDDYDFDNDEDDNVDDNIDDNIDDNKKL